MALYFPALFYGAVQSKRLPNGIVVFVLFGWSVVGAGIPRLHPVTQALQLMLSKPGLGQKLSSELGV